MFRERRNCFFPPLLLSLPLSLFMIVSFKYFHWQFLFPECASFQRVCAWPEELGPTGQGCSRVGWQLQRLRRAGEAVAAAAAPVQLGKGGTTVWN